MCVTQINDTHLQKPIKDAQRSTAFAWHCGKVQTFKAQMLLPQPEPGSHDPGPITSEDFRSKCNVLMGMRVLRDMSTQWLGDACEHILRRGPDGRNVIQRGWDEIYFDRARNPEFLAEALVARDEWKRNEAEDQRKAQAAAIQKAVSKASEQGADVAEAARAAAMEALSAGAGGAEIEANCRALSQVVKDVAVAEKQFHESEVPRVPKKKKSKSGKERLGVGRRGRKVHLQDEGRDGGRVGVGAQGQTNVVSLGSEGSIVASISESEYARMKVVQLKALCKEKGLAVSGNKDELVARLNGREFMVSRLKRKPENTPGDDRGSKQPRAQVERSGGDHEGQDGLQSEGLSEGVGQGGGFDGREIENGSASKNGSDKKSGSESEKESESESKKVSEKGNGSDKESWSESKKGSKSESERVSENETVSGSESESEIGDESEEPEHWSKEEKKAAAAWLSYKEAVLQGKMILAQQRLTKVTIAVNAITVMLDLNGETCDALKKKWEKVSWDLQVAVDKNDATELSKFLFPGC